jgi:hypothetical protein
MPNSITGIEHHQFTFIDHHQLKITTWLLNRNKEASIQEEQAKHPEVQGKHPGGAG